MADPQAQQKKMGQIIAKAWSDEGFKQQLLTNPAAALKAEGVEIPAGVAVRVVENTATTFHLVLPPKPATGELSDEQLGNVAGGFTCVLTDRKHSIT
jgi:hypothetical protein